MANLCMPHPHSLEPMYSGHPYIYPNVPLSPMSLEMYRSLHYIRSNFSSFSPDAALFHPQPIRNFHSFALTQPVHAPQPFATLPKSFYGQDMRRCNAQNTMEKNHPRKKSLKRNRTNSGSSEENEKSEVRARVSFSVASLSKSDSKSGPEDELRPNRNNVTPPPKRALWNPFFSPLRESSDNDSPDSHSSFSDESEGSEPRPKTHVCEQCQRSFTRKSNLERHRRLHSGEKLFVCKDCGAKFSQVANLNYHVRTHTQEKPYHCDHCNRSFRGSSHLKRHIRIHTGERPYKCEICNLAFLSWDQKKRHLKLVHQ